MLNAPTRKRCGQAALALLLVLALSLSFVLGVQLSSSFRHLGVPRSLLSSPSPTKPRLHGTNVRDGGGNDASGLRSAPLRNSLASYRARKDAFRAVLRARFDLNGTRVRQRDAHVFERMPPEYGRVAPAYARTPCWWSSRTGVDAPAGMVRRVPALAPRQRALMCLPAYFLLGPAKTGSTDLHERLQRHPQVARVAHKEPSWWTHGRHDPPRLVGRHTYQLFGRDTRPCEDCMSAYARDLGNAVQQPQWQDGRVPRQRVIVGDASTSTFWALRGVGTPASDAESQKLHNDTLVPQLFRLAVPRAKFIITLREPVSRFVSDFNYHNSIHSHARVRTTEMLDSLCLEPARAMQRCVEGSAPNSGGDPFACAWQPQFGHDPCRMSIGFYSLYLRAWREFWRVRTMHDMRDGRSIDGDVLVAFLDDYDANPRKFLHNIFAFLGIDTGRVGDASATHALTETEWQHILGGDRINQMHGQRAAPSADLRKALQAAYAPFNDDLKALLGLARLPWERAASE